MDYSDLSKRYGPFSTNVDPFSFEMAVMNSARQAFPRADLHGRLFHLTKSMRRQLSENGLLQRYNAEPQFALHAKMIVALAFVPTDNLDDAFDVLSNQLANELRPILNWLEDNYIRRPGRNKRRSRPARDRDFKKPDQVSRFHYWIVGTRFSSLRTRIGSLK